jgi:hypothetical protein
VFGALLSFALGVTCPGLGPALAPIASAPYAQRSPLAAKAVLTTCAPALTDSLRAALASLAREHTDEAEEATLFGKSLVDERSLWTHACAGGVEVFGVLADVDPTRKMPLLVSPDGCNVPRLGYASRAELLATPGNLSFTRQMAAAVVYQRLVDEGVAPGDARPAARALGGIQALLPVDPSFVNPPSILDEPTAHDARALPLLRLVKDGLFAGDQKLAPAAGFEAALSRWLAALPPTGPRAVALAADGATPFGAIAAVVQASRAAGLDCDLVVRGENRWMAITAARRARLRAPTLRVHRAALELAGRRRPGRPIALGEAPFYDLPPDGRVALAAGLAKLRARPAQRRVALVADDDAPWRSVVERLADLAAARWDADLVIGGR